MELLNYHQFVIITKMEKEQLFKSRIIDLAQRAYNRGIVTFTNFLNLQELNIINSLDLRKMGVSYHLFGGYQMSERQIIAFIPEALSYTTTCNEDIKYPIDCLKIAPIVSKFAETLNHRDYLGALVNLGIERSVIGDIVVKENEAYIFCSKRMTSFLIENCIRIKHTQVECVLAPDFAADFTPEFESVIGSVASVRLDAIIGLAFNSSRSSIIGLIEGKKVFVNSKQITSNGYQLKPTDIVSVRGFGKFIYQGELSKTKKGRCRVQVNRYI